MISRVSVIAVLALSFVIPGANSIRSLESFPTSDAGVLTAGIGQQISLTCSHDNDASRTTLWNFSTPVDCTGPIVHLSAANPGVADCGPFLFIYVTVGTSDFNSTAVANATTSMTGAVVQCLDGLGSNAVQVGSNITLCVYDNPPPPANLQCQPMSGGVVEISWSPVPQDCTMSSVYYRISVARVGANETDVQSNDTTKTILLYSLIAGEEYVATLMTVVKDTVRSTMRVSESTNCTFIAEELVVPPTTTSPTDVFVPTVHVPELILPEPWWVIVIFVALAVVIVAIIVLMVKYKRVIFRCCHSGEKEDPPDKTDSFYQDPSTIQHQQATGGDLYALPDMLKKGSKKEKSEEALADMSSVPDNSKKSQDPSTIQHQQAAGGDLYALPDMLKKGSKKEKSEEALADMYSVPDKSKKSQLTSADIDMGGGSGRPVNPVPPMEYPTDGTSVEHEQAPSGEEYEVVTTAKKTVAVDSICQVPCQAHQVLNNSEPIAIHHEQATGDGLYEDIDKPRKGSKNEKSEEALADMSSVPDNSKKSQLTYADMGGESGKPVNLVRQI